MPQKPRKDRYPPSVIGMPGHRTRHDRSGLDYIDSQNEFAHLEGLFIRQLLTGKLRLGPYKRNLILVMAAILCLCIVVSSVAETLRIRAIPTSIYLAIPALIAAIVLLLNIRTTDHRTGKRFNGNKIGTQDSGTDLSSRLVSANQVSGNIKSGKHGISGNAILLIILIILVSTVTTSIILTKNVFRKSISTIHTYLDSNGNGMQDWGEKPLRGVCVWTDESYNEELMTIIDWCVFGSSRTNFEGIWKEAHRFSQCTDIVSYAYTPNGYFATTPSELTGCEVWFGFSDHGNFRDKTPASIP